CQVTCRQILKVLDLGNNHLNGTFPVWLGELPYKGSFPQIKPVPSSYCSFFDYGIFDYGFVGQLPAKYFQNFDAMKDLVIKSTARQYLYMTSEPYSFSLTMKGAEQDFPQLFVAYSIINLSNNKLQSEIPFIIRSLISLKVLDLSHNSLTGPIPRALGKLSELESLDLSTHLKGIQIDEGLHCVKSAMSIHKNRSLRVMELEVTSRVDLRGKWWRWDMYVGHYLDW
nr:leucine-rich repeat-containing protein [Tanacetum cinerariifolium]